MHAVILTFILNNNNFYLKMEWSWSGVEKAIMFSTIVFAGWIYFELKSLNSIHNYT